MKRILVTGASGQLGQSIEKIEGEFFNSKLYFFDSKSLDITQKEQVFNIFEEIQPDFCINCAAFTKVDLAESMRLDAQRVNIKGAEIIAAASKEFKVKLIHISTDYVFDGKQDSPYEEDEKTNPINYYGYTKREGEKAVVRILKEHFVIRTSWLYSEFGHNFVKTMLRLGKERDQLQVVNDQQGNPTYATDLAKGIATIINTNSEAFGSYHFSNQGITTWYSFAKEIFNICDLNVEVAPVPSTAYPTVAKRSHYSAMKTSKFETTFSFHIPNWKESLRQMLSSNRS